ncbi:hypothetical protein TrRE_jg11401 [Triparma retinervis]|uniref:SAM domain-containing protein n=1 Tax=Triparma retinervis TaxID=2557542 RepID=A0A9W6ZE56_9STRA|nr:hypothetical protein TrRE_jg11401 [Triparma retinervis]
MKTLATAQAPHKPLFRQSFENLLARAQVGHLKDNFAKEGICDVNTMLLIDNEEDWKEIGVSRIGDRRRLMNELGKERKARGASDMV